MQTRVCYICKQEKDLDQFSRRAKANGGRDYKCSECNRQQARLYHRAKRTGEDVRLFKVREVDLDLTMSDTRRLAVYGMTKAVYADRVKAVDNCCEICSRPFERNEPYIDHNHKTGKTRGLLCIRCNLLVGIVEASPSLISTLPTYLDRYRSEPLCIPDQVKQAVVTLKQRGIKPSLLSRLTWQNVLQDSMRAGVWHPDDLNAFIPIPTDILDTFRTFAVSCCPNQPLVPSCENGKEPLTPYGCRLLWASSDEKDDEEVDGEGEDGNEETEMPTCTP